MTNPSLQIDEPDAHIDELSPLVHSPPTPTSPPSSLQKNVVRLLYVIVFMLMFGQYLQPGPRTQIYENIVCRNYYEKLQENSFVGKNGTVRPHDCKARPVQEELALLRGWERFGDLFPSMTRLRLSISNPFLIPVVSSTHGSVRRVGGPLWTTDHLVPWLAWAFDGGMLWVHCV